MASTTTVIVPGRHPVTGIPGVKNEAYIRGVYTQDLNLTGLVAEERDEGDVHIVEFKQRSGTKGYLLAA